MHYRFFYLIIKRFLCTNSRCLQRLCCFVLNSKIIYFLSTDKIVFLTPKRFIQSLWSRNQYIRILSELRVLQCKYDKTWDGKRTPRFVRIPGGVQVCLQDKYFGTINLGTEATLKTTQDLAAIFQLFKILKIKPYCNVDFHSYQYFSQMNHKI